MKIIVCLLSLFIFHPMASGLDSDSRNIPSQNGFAVDFGKHGPGDVLTLTVKPDAGCQITQSVLNPSPLGWKPGFSLALGPTAAGVHTGTFGGSYGCGSGAGAGAPPEWKGTADVDACAEKKTNTPIPIQYDIADKNLSWLKKLETLIKKISLVKEATVSATVTGQSNAGTECCGSSAKRTDYVDYTAGGEAALTVILHGGPPALKLPRAAIPIPYSDLALGIAAVLDVGVNGGGTVAIGLSVTGRLGECSCVTITGSGSGQPQFIAGAKGKAGLELVQRSSGDTIDDLTAAELTATVESSMKFILSATTKIGKECAEDPAYQLCITWPSLIFKFQIGVFGFSIPYEVDVTSFFYEAINVKNPTCFPE